MLRIILARHGQTDWNDGSSAGEHFRGQIDVALNATGLAQAAALAEALAPAPIAAVYASPLGRAIDTARPTAEQHRLPVTPFPALLDIDYGQWAGQSHTQVAARWPDLYALWRSAPQQVQIPGGERLSDVRRRIEAGLETLFARHEGQTVLLVGHQAVNKVMICRLLGLDDGAFWRIGQDTGCLNRFDYDGQVATVLALNETCHLRPRS